MNFGVNIKYFTKNIPMEKAAKFLSKAGLNALDFVPDCKIDSWESEMNSALEIFGKENLYVHQTHAPMNRYGRSGDNHKEHLNRSLEAARIMGAKYLVVHGDEFDFANLEYSPEAALEYNYELFAPIVDKAKGYGIKVAFETVFEDGRPFPRFTSQSSDLKAIIEKFNSDNVCCCWDFGHAGVEYEDAHPDKILELGKYIECTHVHDCGHKRDLHLPPYLGSNNWDLCMKAMKEIGYDGDITFEMVYGEIPEDMGEEFALYLRKIADSLATKMNK